MVVFFIIRTMDCSLHHHPHHFPKTIQNINSWPNFSSTIGRYWLLFPATWHQIRDWSPHSKQYVIYLTKNTANHWYSIIFFLQNNHNRYPLDHLWGQGMGSLLRVRPMFTFLGCVVCNIVPTLYTVCCNGKYKIQQIIVLNYIDLNVDIINLQNFFHR